jgi:hypothetical protein
MQKTALQNSAPLLISNEMKRASGFSVVEVAFIPSSVIGIWAYADKERSKNFAPEDGYITDGKKIYLTSESFTYCDQLVFVSYYADGMVKNTIVYSSETYEDPEATDLFGEVTLVASVSGREATDILYVDNSCRCKPSLSVKVDPTTITLGQGTATIEAYVENGGMPVSGTVRMTEVSGFGTLSWSTKDTETLLIEGEKTESINTVSGQTQCVLSSMINSVVGVWLTNDDNEKLGSNLYSSHYGRTIDLNTYVLTGTDLIVDYNRAGSVRNYLTGKAAGVSRVDVSVDTNTEEGLTQSVQVTVQAVPEETDTPPTPSGGSEVPSPSFVVQGPAACVFRAAVYYYNNRVVSRGATGSQPYYQKFGPYRLYKDGVAINATMAVIGTGYVQLSGSMYFETTPVTPSQRITVTLSGGGGNATMEVTYTGAPYSNYYY